MAGPVTSLLYQWFVELSPSTRVYACPAVFTVILQTGNIGTKEWSKFSTTASALAFITHLIIQHIWLHFHLHQEGENSLLEDCTHSFANCEQEVQHSNAFDSIKGFQQRLVVKFSFQPLYLSKKSQERSLWFGNYSTLFNVPWKS